MKYVKLIALIWLWTVFVLCVSAVVIIIALLFAAAFVVAGHGDYSPLAAMCAITASVFTIIAFIVVNTVKDPE